MISFIFILIIILLISYLVVDIIRNKDVEDTGAPYGVKYKSGSEVFLAIGFLEDRGDSISLEYNSSLDSDVHHKLIIYKSNIIDKYKLISKMWSI